MEESRYRKYLLTVLLLILVFNFVDRLALGLVLQKIKTEFSVSDSQLGLLSGFAFALFYSVLGIPIARWADRGNRVVILAVTTALWSIGVLLCGVARSFTQLIVIRMAVGVGEAGCMPTAHSLIADHFTRAERPKAVATYMLGAPLSAVIGYFLAGWLNELYGWRTTFKALAVPGIALAILALSTLRDPRAKARKGEGTSPTRTSPRLREVAVALWGNRTFVHLLICFSVTSFFGYGLLQWQPAFFVRSYGMSTGELGTWLAVIYGVGGVLGTYAGGELASRRAVNNESLQLKGMAIGYCSFALASLVIYSVHNQYVAFALMGVSLAGLLATNGPLFATIQTLVPGTMRAMAIAVIYLFANLIGLGLGPWATGVLSDMLSPVFGGESLRYALICLCPGYAWAAWHLWKASRTVSHDLASVRSCA